MFNLVAGAEPWAEDLLALVDREPGALAGAGRGRVGGDEGVLPLMQGNQALLRQMCDLSMREVVALRADVAKGDLALRAVVASFQSFVNEARRGEAPVVAPLAAAPFSEALDKMEELCRTIEAYPVRFPGKEPSEKQMGKWLVALEDALFLLAKRPLLERSVFDEERIGLFAGKISREQECILRNEPMSSQLLAHYLALRKKNPEYDPDKVQLGSIKDLFVGTELFESVVSDYFKKVYETLHPHVQRITRQIGEELVDAIWRKRSYVEVPMRLVTKEQYDVIPVEYRTDPSFLRMTQERAHERYFKDRNERFFVDIGLPLSKLGEEMEKGPHFPIIYPQVSGAEGTIAATYMLAYHHKCDNLYLAQRLGLGAFYRTYQFEEEKERLVIYDHFKSGEDDLMIFRSKIPMNKTTFEMKGIQVIDFEKELTVKWNMDKSAVRDFEDSDAMRRAIREKWSALKAQAVERLQVDPDFQSAIEKMKEEWKPIQSMAEYFLMEIEKPEERDWAYTVFPHPDLRLFHELTREEYPKFVDGRFT